MTEGWPTHRKVVSMKLTLLMAALAFVVTFAVVILFKPHAVTTGDLGQLQKGMTTEEVRGVLGEPGMTTKSFVAPEETWVYELPRSRWSVTTTHVEMTFYEGRLDSWWETR